MKMPKSKTTVDCDLNNTISKTFSSEQVRIAAYLNWEKQTGGNPVDEDSTRQFWLEAEQQVTSQDNQ